MTKTTGTQCLSMIDEFLLLARAQNGFKGKQVRAAVFTREDHSDACLE
jgi:hypothetical protein